ncbi:hypothetical protein Salpa_4698 [Sporomusa sp. KB1]|jgi:hypothetical protein|nr:hypothetical protein Salpa_4698 [Sporomusa sp. KB1]
MTRRGYAATCIPDRRERQRMRRWDRQCGKTISIQHDKSAYEMSLRRAVMAEIREFAR